MLPDFKFYINDNTRIKPEWQIYHTYEFRSFGPELTIMAILFIVITITGGAITAIKNETKYIKTLKRVSIMSLCIFGISMFAWHLLPLSRSDTGIIPRSYTPFIACISVFSAFILLSPLTCGFIYLFKKDNRFIGLKYIGFVGLGILLFTIAVLVKIYRTGVF